jgi:hypothetical protein
VAENLQNLILEKTEGIPFFLEEFLKSLKDLQIIQRQDTIYALTKDPRDVRDLEFAELPYIMSPYTQIGGISYEDIDLESKWSIPTNCRFGFSFG